MERFVEKPSLEKAQEYLDAGGYFWNAGMFVWRPDVILGAISKHAPELSAGLKELVVQRDSTGSIEQAMELVYPSLQKMKLFHLKWKILEKIISLLQIDIYI